MHWLVTVLLLLPSLAFGQVNVEALRSTKAEDGFTGSAAFSIAYTGGNIQFADFGSTAKVGWKHDKDLVLFVMNYRFAAKRTQSDLLAEPDIDLWDEEAHFSNNRLAHLRYNRLLSGGLWWEVYGQYEYNEFLLLDRRLLVGTGPRIMLVDAKSVGLAVGTSAMFEEERLNPDGIAPSEEEVRINGRSSTYASVTIRPSETTTWTTTVYMQPLFTSLDDYRLVVESGFAFRLAKKLSFTVDARYRKDSDPPATPAGAAPILETDFSLKNGLKLTF